MRLGLVLEGESIDELALRAAAAETNGVELGWLPSSEGALMSAAALASSTSAMRIAACMPVGTHPLEIAEGAAVADNCTNGRLILVLEDPTGDQDLFDETVEVILAATTPRPFRHRGSRWTIPANLPENDQHELRLLVTPMVVQPQLPIWVMGPAAPGAARRWCLPLVAGDRHGGSADAEPFGERAQRLPRILIGDVAHERGEWSADELVHRLREQRDKHGVDTAVLHFDGLTTGEWSATATRLARHVRPRVLLDALPQGLESHWKSALPD